MEKIEVLEMNRALIEATRHWKYIAPLLAYPESEKDYENLRDSLDELLDIVGEDETHYLMSLVDVLSSLIAQYEAQDEEEKLEGRGVDALKFLMKSNGLHQTDLSEIGSQGVISEILNEKRSLNLRQIKLLSNRFHVAPSTFIDL